MLHSTKIEIIGKYEDGYRQILSEQALQFIVFLETKFSEERRYLLEKRERLKQAFDQGKRPEFLSDTPHIRKQDWKCAPVPPDLQDRRVEITGPVDRKMIINALNSGAKVFMADFEDSNSPTWHNCIQGQINLRDAVNKSCDYTDPNSGKHYQLNEQTATLMVRPRGWHLIEKHVLLNGKPISASLFDFGLYLFHNHQALNASNTGPYFYLPKLESHQEAILWDDVFTSAQEYLGIAHGTIKATVLIETITAAFEMDEILFALRNHSAGLNCGRWDYIFSFIKKFKKNANCIMPNRNEVSMKRHFLKSYVDLLIKTCHKRGAHAMGGMAAQIPIKGDEAANQQALDKVLEDKKREVEAGHDGTWVAHPGLIPIAMQAFQSVNKNQLDVCREEVEVGSEDLLKVPTGSITEEGIRENIRVALIYMSAWLEGNGCVPINHLMEDAATAEICRAQLWQWLYHGAHCDDGRMIEKSWVQELLAQEAGKIDGMNKLPLAKQCFEDMIFSEEFDEFLTLPTYEYLT